jgi:hypothetical protein
MASEQEFFQSLRSVVIHLIKHVEELYDMLVPYLTPYEEGQWSDYSPEQKRKHISELRALLNGSDPISKYFASYPHKWSKDRFALFLERLEAFHAELSQTAKV